MRRINRRKRSTTKRPYSSSPTLICIGVFELSYRSVFALLIAFAITRNFVIILKHQHSTMTMTTTGIRHDHDLESINRPMTIESWLELTSKAKSKKSSSSAAAAAEKTPRELVDEIIATKRRREAAAAAAKKNGTTTTTTTIAISESLRRENVDRSGPHGVHIVISHCTESIAWFFGKNLKTMSQNNNYSVKTITVISKCGYFIPYEDLRISCSEEQPLVILITLPNNGRNDHSFAYWISTILSKDKEYREESKDDTDHIPISGNTTHEVLFVNDILVERCMVSSEQKKKKIAENENGNGNGNNPRRTQDEPFQRIADVIDRDHLIIFMKDNNNIYRNSIEAAMPLKQILEQTLFNNATNYQLGVNSRIKAPSFPRGVACGSIPHLDNKLFEWTSWAHRSILWTFYLNQYRRKGNEKFGGFTSPWRPMGNWILHLATEGNRYDDLLPSTTTTTTTKNGTMMTTTTTTESERHPYRAVFSDDYLEHAVSRFDPEYVPPTFNATKEYVVPDIVPICFGGVFSSQWGQIASPDAALTLRGWKAIAAALTREDNLEEGHFMERWWMDLLSWSTYNRDNWSFDDGDEATTTTTVSSGNNGNGHGRNEIKHVAALAAATGNGTRFEELRRKHARVRTSTVSSQEDQRRLLHNKARHFARPSPYTGVILLYTQQIRQRSAILSGWEEVRQSRERKKKKKKKNRGERKRDDGNGNDEERRHHPPDGNDGEEGGGEPAEEDEDTEKAAATTDFERMRDERHKMDRIKKWWT